MSNRRDRHGRGIRGPLSLPNPLTRSAVQVPSRLAGGVLHRGDVGSVQRLMTTCPDALAAVDIGVEDGGGAFDWANLDRVPLAAAVDAAYLASGKEIVILRRPLGRGPPTARTCATWYTSLWWSSCPR